MRREGLSTRQDDGCFRSFGQGQRDLELIARAFPRAANRPLGTRNRRASVVADELRLKEDLLPGGSRLPETADGLRQVIQRVG